MARFDIFKSLSALLVLLNIVVLGLLMFAKTATDISPEYYTYYWRLGLACTIVSFLIFIIDWGLRQSNPISEILYLFEKRQYGNMTVHPAALFVFVVVAIAIAAMVSFTKTAALATPNPYSSSFVLSSQNHALFAEHSGLLNFFTSAVVPGLFEDQLVFHLILGGSALILLIWSLVARENVAEDPWKKASVMFIMLVLSSMAFAWAHGRYGGNTQAYVYAFSLGFIMQSLNLALGGFGSFIIHIAHNAAVVKAQAFSFVVFSVIPIPWWRWKREK